MKKKKNGRKQSRKRNQKKYSKKIKQVVKVKIDQPEEKKSGFWSFLGNVASMLPSINVPLV